MALLAVVGLGTRMQRKRKRARELFHIDGSGHPRCRCREPFIDQLALLVDRPDRVVGEALIHVLSTEQKPAAEIDAGNGLLDTPKAALGQLAAQPALPHEAIDDLL